MAVEFFGYRRHQLDGGAVEVGSASSVMRKCSALGVEPDILLRFNGSLEAMRSNTDSLKVLPVDKNEASDGLDW